VSFAVKFNGELLKKFRTSRGLHQGDLFSPYLFYLLLKAFHLFSSNKYTATASMTFNYEGPGISHLLFADESLLFSELRKSKPRKSIM
jgi:hypothetical protein